MNISAPSALRFIAQLLSTWLLCSSCHFAFAQAAASSDYTTSLPSVEKVETQLQGSDPIDTTARQVAVFEYLQVYIERIRDGRQYNGPYTPGELQHRTDYAKAQYDLTQNFTKTHSAADVKTFQQKEGNYSVNNALDWIKQFEGQQAADTYKGTEATLAQSYQQHEDQMQQQQQQQQGGGGGLLGGLLGAGGASTSLNADQRRCLELGGSYNACAGVMMGLVQAIGSLVTMGASDTSANQPPPLSGVILVGDYHSRADLPEISLTANGGALLSKCGTLVDATHPYTLRKSSATTQIVADNEPNPIVLTLRSDGSLSGPGAIQVKGSIITGYHVVTTTRTGNCAPNCVTSSSTPIYAPSMQSCTISQLAPQPPPPPPAKPTGMVAAVGDLFGASDPIAQTYGFRVIGPYAGSSGMLLSFDNSYVTLDCGQAHVNVPYTVDNTPSGLVVRVQNGGGAFALTVATDNTLRGSGSTTINGRLVSAVNGQNVSFTPHSENCSIGTFTPKGAQNTMFASNAPVAATPSYTAPTPLSANGAATVPGAPTAFEASLAGAGIAPSGDARVSLRVLFTSNFTGANPMANQTVFVLRKPIEQVLSELGVAIPAGANAGRAMAALQTLCHSSQGCSSVVKGLSGYYVTTAKLDASGNATVSATAATGTY